MLNKIGPTIEPCGTYDIISSKVLLIFNQTNSKKVARKTHHNEVGETGFRSVVLCFQKKLQARNVRVFLSLVPAARRTSNYV